MKRKIGVLATALLFIGSVIVIFGAMGGLETDFLTVGQAVRRVMPGMTGLGVATYLINRYNMGREEGSE